MFREREGTKTRRREARRGAREALGTSSDDAPDAGRALRAADGLREILDDATSGTLSLVIYDARNGGDYKRPSSILAEMRRERETWPDAAGRAFR